MTDQYLSSELPLCPDEQQYIDRLVSQIDLLNSRFSIINHDGVLYHVDAAQGAVLGVRAETSSIRPSPGTALLHLGYPFGVLLVSSIYREFWNPYDWVRHYVAFSTAAWARSTYRATAKSCQEAVLSRFLDGCHHLRDSEGIGLPQLSEHVWFGFAMPVLVRTGSGRLLRKMWPSNVELAGQPRLASQGITVQPGRSTVPEAVLLRADRAVQCGPFLVLDADSDPERIEPHPAEPCGWWPVEQAAVFQIELGQHPPRSVAICRDGNFLFRMDPQGLQCKSRRLIVLVDKNLV